MVGLRGEAGGVAVRGQSDDFHAVGQIVRDLGRALADGAGGSQDDDAALSHAGTTTPGGRSAAGRKTAAAR